MDGSVPPSYPNFPPYLRLARAGDVARMAELSVQGFKDSEIFRFERPRYDKFPIDAVASFANLSRDQLLDPGTVVIVAEDDRLQGDESHVPHQAGAFSHRAVVGVASWNFPDDSPRIGQFVVPDVSAPEPSPDRDLCRRRLDLFSSISKATEEK
jgi:hypothetical protein